MDVKERRRGPDGLTRVLRGLVILCWGGFIVLLSLYHFALPEVAYGFLVYGGIKVRQSWDPQLTPWLLHGLWGCCLLTLAVLLAERWRCCWQSVGVAGGGRTRGGCTWLSCC